MHSSLTLGAILIYILNALNYRPAEGQRETDLTKTCCWNLYPDDTDSDVVESDEDEDLIPVLLDYGLYFISGVYLQDGKALRMGRGDTVSMDSIMRLYKVRNEQDINIAFNLRTWHADPDQVNYNRTRNRRKVPLDVRLVASKDELTSQNTTLSDLGIRNVALCQEAGPDITTLHPNRLQDNQQESMDDIVSRLWRQFPYDIFENAPNHKSNLQGCHLLLSESERREATIDIFQTTDLSQLFSKVVVKIVEPEKWKSLIFRRYFPPKGYKPPTQLQGFPRMGYFQEWNTMMKNLSSEHAKVVRDTI